MLKLTDFGCPPPVRDGWHLAPGARSWTDSAYGRTEHGVPLCRRSDVLNNVEWMCTPDGTTLFEEGDRVDFTFVVLKVGALVLCVSLSFTQDVCAIA